MPSVYLETTIPSYLVSRPIRDLITAAHQQITIEWWRTAKDRFDIYISEAVLQEIQAGDAETATRRIAIVADLKILRLSPDVESLVHLYSRRLGLTGASVSDLPHLAFAVAYNIDYLVTWNCKHIANGQVIKRLMKINSDIGRSTPIILTPEELSETNLGEVP